MHSYPSFSHRPLWRALVVSLLLHAALLAWGAWLPSLLPKISRAPEALRVRLIDLPPLLEAQPAPQPELLMREDTKPAAQKSPLQKTARERLPPKAPATVPAPGARMLAGEAARDAAQQVARQLLYPTEAIAQGLEGEALVLLFLDESGNAVAARIEASSGHALLDEAAVRAARTLRSLPASAPREAFLPVRFRLR